MSLSLPKSPTTHGVSRAGWRPSPSLVLQSLLYLGSGVNHFVHKGFYVSIMPTHYDHPEGCVVWSGVAEIAGGLGLLIPRTRRLAAAGLVVLLLVFLDVHTFILWHPERFPQVPRPLLWARLPLQFALIAWAAIYLRRSTAGRV